MERTPLIYIVGTGRSGSTLLDLMLAADPHVTGVGEFSNFTDWVNQDDPCTCGRPVGACELWGPILAAVPEAADVDVSFGVGFRRQLNRALRCILGASLTTEEQATARVNHELLRRVVGATGSAYVVDSSKDLGRACLLYLSGRFDMHIIHLVRDARGVVFSRSKTKPREQFVRERPDLAERAERWPERKRLRPTGYTYRRWMAFNAAILAVGVARWRRHYRLVRYERLAAEPERAMAEIREWLGLDIHVAPAEAAIDAHNIGGNRMRFKPVTEVRVDDEWRRSLGKGPRALYALYGVPLVAALCNVVARRRPAPPTHGA